jgi:hypothetical protein
MDPSDSESSEAANFSARFDCTATAITSPIAAIGTATSAA